jgi:hypothetical protein
VPPVDEVKKCGNLAVGVAASCLLFDRHDSSQLEGGRRILVEMVSQYAYAKPSVEVPPERGQYGVELACRVQAGIQAEPVDVFLTVEGGQRRVPLTQQSWSHGWRQSVANEQRQNRLISGDLRQGGEHVVVVVEIHQYAMAEDDVKGARREFGCGLAGAPHHMHSATYLGRLVGKGLFKLSQQIIGGIEPSYLMTRACQYQSLRALSAPHIQNTLSRLQDLSQLRRDELLTNDVPQLTESVDPAFFGAREAHTEIPTRPIGHVPSAAPRIDGIKA